MNPYKAAGPDSMSPALFQNLWSTVGPNDFCLNLKNHVFLPPCLNDAPVVLVHKTSNSERVAHFRPISLCNAIYKIISKAIGNRLKLILSKIISSNQRAFVLGRLITDNIGVAFETMHFLNNCKAQG